MNSGVGDAGGAASLGGGTLAFFKDALPKKPGDTGDMGALGGAGLSEMVAFLSPAFMLL